jgi:hypothetical protein
MKETDGFVNGYLGLGFRVLKTWLDFFILKYY